MKRIPEQIKIQGKLVRVDEDTKGGVGVGQSYIELSQDQKEQASKLSGIEHIEKWQGFMYKAFEIALKKERKRIKNLRK